MLAANGRAAIGDLRYYAETKLDAFATPLAKAQIGAALALYGDKPRADAVFRAALGALYTPSDATHGWRSDYGSDLRDSAATLTLASETRTGIDLVSLSSRVETERLAASYTSTQEDAWSLLAAHALMESLSEPKLVVDGEPLNGPLFRSLDADSLAIAPLEITNKGDRPIEVGITVRGMPATPEPAGGNYYSLTREYYTLDGEPVDLAHGRTGRAHRRRPERHHDGEPGRAAGARRSAPRGLRDRQPAHPRKRRRCGARLAARSSTIRRMWSSAPTGSSRLGILPPTARRSSSSPTSSAPCRPAPSCIRRH